MKKANAIFGMMLILIAATAGVSAASFLEEEAGISASVQLAGANLNQAATVFKNIETRTDGYIVGSVTVEGYGEDHDAHVYLDTSGHMVAYYLKTEPASKIIDWVNYTGGPMTLKGSKLEDALTKVCGAMFMTLPAVTYFDFRYPNGQRIKIIMDEKLGDGIETFRLFIPGGHAVYSASWSHGINDAINYTRTNYLRLNGSNLFTTGSNLPNGWNTYSGFIGSENIVNEVYHNFEIRSGDGQNTYSAILLIYRDFN